MAQRIVVQLVDDLDGTSLTDGGGSTVSFALDGTAYEIDLSQANAQRLRDALAEFIAAGRKVGGRSTAKRGGGSRSSSSIDAAVVREWARTQGLQVSERGRVSADIIEAYNAKH
jgi:hypothetical protein